MRLLLDLFLVFTRVALFSWGGGPASLALMQREVIAAGWLNSAEFADAVAVGTALPGPIAPQVSAWVGYRVAGVSGAVAATTGTVIPATVLMLVMVVFFLGVKDNTTIRAMLAAVRPVVVGLLIWTAYDMARAILGVQRLGWSHALTQGSSSLVLTLVAFLILVFTKVNPAFLVLGASLFGLAFYRN